MIYHVFTAEKYPVGAKYVVEFLSLLSNFEKNYSEHTILVKISSNEKYKEKINAYLINNKIKTKVTFYTSYYCLIKYIINKSSKIILHELTSNRLAFQLFFHPQLCKRCSWVIWGGDLYHYALLPVEFSSLKRFLINNLLRRPVIRKFNKIICLRQDFELAKRMYKLEENFLLGFYDVKFEQDVTTKKIDNKPTLPRIMVGHSASPSNNHIDLFRVLKPIHNCNFYVVCPLSYGNVKYREEVIQSGKSYFGDFFVPILKHMDPDGYQKFISNMDVLLFDSPRQQGIGNLTLGIRSLKKIYMRSEATPYKWFEENGIFLCDVNNLHNANLKSILYNDSSIAVSNKICLEKIYNKDKLVQTWSDIFRSC